MKPILDSILQAIAEHRTFLILGHQDVDGDCVGCQLALYHWLTARGKTVVVVSNGPTFCNYLFLPGCEVIARAMPEDFAAEVTIAVDTASPDRLLAGARLQGRVINIDHHLGNSTYGDLNWVEPEAAAVGEMVFTLLEHAGAPLTPEIAQSLFIAIMTDTGSFRHTYTSARTFEIAAALVRAGAHPHSISNAFHNNVHPDTIRMAGEILSSLHFECEGRLVWGELTRDIYEALGGLERQPEQLASQMRAIQGVEVAVLFHETDGGGRVSFRSRGRVNAAKAAEELGGGGHASAAGCRFAGDYVANRDRVLEVVRRHVMALPD
jgi:phosphoesterase RecJ-like protein